MDPIEAFHSNKFHKRVWNRKFPNSNLWLKPTSLCVFTNTVQTREPLKQCEEWQVNLKERKFGKDRLFFDSFAAASRQAEKSNSRGNPVCSKAFKETLWSSVTDYGKLNFRVDFFAKSHRDRYSDDKFLGRHTFSISPCESGQLIQEAILDGGEFSGGSRKLRGI